MATRGKPRSTEFEMDTRDPALWTHQQCVTWISTTTPKVTPEWLLSTTDTGMHLCRTPELTFFSRVRPFLLCSASCRGGSGSGRDWPLLVYTDTL